MILTDKHKIKIKEILKLSNGENKLTELKLYLFSIENELNDDSKVINCEKVVIINDDDWYHWMVPHENS